jgi:chloramphenicol-sensitive protein RarD
MSARAEGLDRPGLIFGFSAYTVWGVFPLVFQAMHRAGASPWEILAWRTLWAVPCAFALILVLKRGPQVRAALRQPRELAWLALAASFIAVNWGVYIWAVNARETLAASLGYFITPLLNVAAGAVIFGERLSPTAKVAIGLAAVGVVVQSLGLGAFPWISLILATSFAAYGVVRKRLKVDAQTGLLIECSALALPSAVYALVLASQGQAHFGTGWGVSLLLMLAGPATVIPLALFGEAAKRLPMTAIGFLQFIAPTIQFGIGLAEGEPFKLLNLAAFALIWLGGAVFIYDAWRKTRQLRAAAAA